MDVEELLAERACERVLHEVVAHLDRGTPSDAARLFTPDGVWEWPDGRRRISGRDAVAVYFGSRPADRLSCRLTTNVLVTLDGPDAARVTSSFVTYRVDGWDGAALIPPPAVQVGHYDDTFRRIGGAWLIAHRVLHLTFGGPTPRPGSS